MHFERATSKAASVECICSMHSCGREVTRSSWSKRLWHDTTIGPRHSVQASSLEHFALRANHRICQTVSFNFLGLPGLLIIAVDIQVEDNLAEIEHVTDYVWNQSVQVPLEGKIKDAIEGSAEPKTRSKDRKEFDRLVLPCVPKRVEGSCEEKAIDQNDQFASPTTHFIFVLACATLKPWKVRHDRNNDERAIQRVNYSVELCAHLWGLHVEAVDKNIGGVDEQTPRVTYSRL